MRSVHAEGSRVPLRRAAGAAAACVALACLVAPARADVTTVGTDFWAADLDNLSAGGQSDLGIAVAPAGPAAVHVLVEDAAGPLDSGVVAAGDLHVFRLDRRHRQDGTAKSLAAIHVVSDAPVAAYVFNPLDNVDSNDASTLLPVPALGTATRVLARQATAVVPGDNLPSELVVVGVGPGTTHVTLALSCDTRAGALPAGRAGGNLAFTLEPYEAAQVQSAAVGDDLTGTLVTSDQPVAVFGGTQCTYIPDGTTACDHLEEEMLPETAWGTQYVVTKFAPRGGEPDFVRILAAGSRANLTFDPPVAGAPSSVPAGQWVEIAIPGDVSVTASAPVGVAQYMVSEDWGAGLGVGDPSEMLAIPTARFDTTYTFLAPDTFAQSYVNLVAPAGTTVTLDGSQVDPAAFVPVGASGFSRAVLPLASGAHHASATAPFGASAYAYDNYASWACPAGARTPGTPATVSCVIAGPLSVACGGGAVALDASGSTGAGPLTFTWVPLTTGVVVGNPAAAVTSATLSGPGPFAVGVTVTSGADAAFCAVDVAVTDDVPPVVACAAQVRAAATSPGQASVTVVGAVTDDCDPSPSIANDRTSGGADATDVYPCGTTLVTFTGRDVAGNSSSCTTQVVVFDASVPAEPGMQPASAALRVRRDPVDPRRLDVWCGGPVEPTSLVSLYVGTLPPMGMRRYDHAPITCHAVPATGPAPGTLALSAPLDAGRSHYYLLATSNCLGESTLGFRSDGVERPVLPGACGAL